MFLLIIYFDLPTNRTIDEVGIKNVRTTSQAKIYFSVLSFLENNTKNCKRKIFQKLKIPAEVGATISYHFKRILPVFNKWELHLPAFAFRNLNENIPFSNVPTCTTSLLGETTGMIKSLIKSYRAVKFGVVKRCKTPWLSLLFFL